MRTLRLFLIILAAGIALSGFSWFAYSLYKKFHRPAETPFNAIPGNTAVIIQLNKAGNLLEELNRSNLLWKTLSRIPGISIVKDELQFVDSAGRKNENINQVLQRSNMLIAITLTGRTNFGAIYLARVAGSNPESYINNFVDELAAGKATVTESPYYTTTLKRIRFRGGRSDFYYAVLKGVFIGSFHGDLVKRAIDRLSLNTPMAASAGFRKVEATSGKKVDANIYVNYRLFSLVMSKMTVEANLPDLVRLSKFADWSGLDLIIKKDELLFNGVTVASDSNQQFLALFSDQEPQKKTVTAIMPAKTLYYTFYGWSDPMRYCQRFQGRTTREDAWSQEISSAQRIIERYQLNINEYFMPWIGNEGSHFAIEDPKTQRTISYYALSTIDSAGTVSSLKELADTLGIKLDSVLIRDHRIYRMEMPAFLPLMFGDIFGQVQPACFTFLKGFVVFTGNYRDFEPLIREIREHTTLENDKNYKDFENSLSEKSNVFSYFSTQNALELLKKSMNTGLTEQLAPVMDSLRKFESMAFQFSNSDGQFYTNIFLRYNPSLGGEGPMEWQAKLDTSVAGRPRIMRLAPSGAAGIVVTDSANNLYMISADGNIEWKIRLTGAVLGEIHPLRMPGSDSLCLLFNTNTHLYLLHADGRFADRYPMKFPLPATNGLTLTDWDNGSDPKILVALKDKRVYCFTLEGLSVQSWKRPGLKTEIGEPVRIVKSRAGWNVLISDGAGNAMITDRNGRQQVMPGPKFLHAPSSAIYLNRTSRRGTFLTTDPGGKLVFLQENGKTTEVTLNLFSTGHRFFYADITGNGQPELIFIDRDKVYFYNQSFKLIYSYPLRHVITTPPFIVSSGPGKVLLGITLPETNELFLFNGNGYCELESGIRGNTPFDIGNLGNGPLKSLVVGSGKLLKSYRLTEPE